MNDERLLPPAKPSGWKWVIGVFLLLGAIGVTLSLVYRDYSDNNDPTVRERRSNAELVSYALVFSNVDPSRIDGILDGIIGDIGADSARTDLVIGASASKPWSRSIADYRASLRVAMTDAKDLPIGKQTLITSMVAGLLIKSEMPATVYLIGTLSGPVKNAVGKRTQESVDALQLRQSTRGPIRIVSYIDTSNAFNAEYVQFFRNSSLPFEQR